MSKPRVSELQAAEAAPHRRCAAGQHAERQRAEQQKVEQQRSEQVRSERQQVEQQRANAQDPEAAWIRRAELPGSGLVDVRLAGGRIAEVCAAQATPGPGLDAAGGALLPGLHDHHLHLLALAASLHSLPCGPPEVQNERELARVLAGATPGTDGWLRGVGYHEQVAGALDRRALDRLEARRPLRIQHRSGALWMLNSPAVRELGLDEGADAPGVERNASGRASGRLLRADSFLRERLAACAHAEAQPESKSGPDAAFALQSKSKPAPQPESKSAAAPALELASVGQLLAGHGITGVTDASPENGPEEFTIIESARSSGALPQRVTWMGGPQLPPASAPEAPRAWKLLVDDFALPTPDELGARIAGAHAAGRPVAVHCVTRATLVVVCAALESVGVMQGDRIEHASVAPPETLEWLARLGVCVVTQPGFVRERGDSYLRDVPVEEHPWLYRGNAFVRAGIPLGAGSDAPYGSADPWRAMHAAVTRRTHAGKVLGADEALTPERALALFTTSPEAPGGTSRRVQAGAAADLCLLSRPWRDAREALDAADLVRATWCAGERVFVRGEG